MNKNPLVVAYGLGADSTAMLMGMADRGIRPDAILFADVGGEKDETYRYLPVMDAFLDSVGFPRVTVVRYQPSDFKHYPPYHSLEQNCLTNGTLPSEAFGFGSCSQKWKAQPQQKWLKAWEPARKAWATGGVVRRAIGFDASGADSKRRYKADALEQRALREGKEVLFEYWYPLQEWGWTRDQCIARIVGANLPGWDPAYLTGSPLRWVESGGIPMKSSCFFCPNMTPAEVRLLPADKLRRIVLMEARAKPRLTDIEGLWRNGCKGKRDPSKKRPGSMTEFIRQEGLLPAAEIDKITADVPKALLTRADAHANGFEVESWEEFFDAAFAECGTSRTMETEAFEV